MPRSISFLVTLFCTCLCTALITPAQSTRTVPVGLGLGHLVRGVGNPPCRLSNDTFAIVSEGATEGTGVLDDQILIVSGFESGVLSMSQVGLLAALTSYADVSHTLVRLDATTVLYLDRGVPGGHPTFLVVSGAGSTNKLWTHALTADEAFDIESQPTAVFDGQTMIWSGKGPDGVLGTKDDRICYAFGLGTPTCTIGSVGANEGLGAEVMTAGTRAVARGFGPDGIMGTIDDELILVDVAAASVRILPVPVKAGLAVFTVANAPVLVGADTLVYPTVGAKSLYAVISGISRSLAVNFTGSINELPLGVALPPQPVAIARDHFVYFNAGADGVFHDGDDEVCVVKVAKTLSRQIFVPGVGLGLSDTSIPPVDLGDGRVVFGTNGPDHVFGTADDGVLVAEGLLTDKVKFRHVPSGVQVVSMAGVNAGTVAMQALDSTFSFFQGLETPAPSFTQFTTGAVPCASCFVRLNDWTMVGTTSAGDPLALADDIVTVQFPFVELIGHGQVCSTGHELTISRDVAPVIGTNWPAVVKGGSTGMPAALLLSWFKDDVALNPACHFYLDYGWLFQSNIRIVDVIGEATVWNYIEPLPGLPGHSFCGQWGMYDPLGYGGLCVSGGFRVHF